MSRDILMKSIVVGILAIFLAVSVLPAAGSIIKQKELEIRD